MTLTIAGVPASNLSGALAQITQPGETSLAVPPPASEGGAFGQRLAVDCQGPDTQRQTDVLA